MEVLLREAPGAALHGSPPARSETYPERSQGTIHAHEDDQRRDGSSGEGVLERCFNLSQTMPGK